MIQCNVSTGWQRDVRCAPWKPSLVPASAGQWEWQDENDGWNPYPPGVQRLLEACQLCGVDQWEIEAAGRQYKVDIGSGSEGQTNIETGVQRAVRYNQGTLVKAVKEEGNVGRILKWVGLMYMADYPNIAELLCTKTFGANSNSRYMKWLEDLGPNLNFQTGSSANL